jgi:chaperonin GroEL
LEDIQVRVAQLKHSMDNEQIPAKKRYFAERLAKITGGVAVLYVGATTEAEMKEKKDRVDDALHATRAAIEEGIVAGGGVALIRCMGFLERKQVEIKGDMNEDEISGFKIIKSALEAPMRCIVENAGADFSQVLSNVLANDDNDFGFNARTMKFENMKAAGIIDPTKVTRVALENAASIAIMFITTECVVVEEPTNENKA